MSDQATSGFEETEFPVSFKADHGKVWQELRKASVGLFASITFVVFLVFREFDAVFVPEFSAIHALCIAGILSAGHFLRKRNAIKSRIGNEEDSLLTIDREKIRDHMTFHPDTGTFCWRDIETFTCDSAEGEITFELSAPWVIEHAPESTGEPADTARPSGNGDVSRQQYRMSTEQLGNQVPKFTRILTELGAEER